MAGRHLQRFFSVTDTGARLRPSPRFPRHRRLTLAERVEREQEALAKAARDALSAREPRSAWTHVSHAKELS